jgi:hypothetical protein
MQIDCKEQNLKHDSSIRFNLDPNSNVIDPISFRCHILPAKHNLNRISIELGMQIDCNEQNSKHACPIRFNLDSDSNEIDCSLEPRRHDLQRISTELGMQIDCNEQNSKHDSPIRFNRDSDSNEMDASFEFLKHDLHRISTDLGMQIDCNEQDSKHDVSVRFNFDSGSNVTDPILFGLNVSPAKHDLHRISTELGMRIDCNEQNSKHDSSIRLNLDPGSNVTDPILFGLNVSPAKHDLPTISTEFGMQIDCNEHNLKHDSPIRFNCDSDSNEIDCSFETRKHDLHKISTELGR